MGCCLCQPVSEIVEDPEVIMHAEMEKYLLVSQQGTSGITGSGLIYVKNGYLHARDTCNDKLCCLFCTDSWPLSKITNVQVVTGDIRSVTSNKVWISVNHGLKITIAHRIGSDSTLVVDTPEGTRFCLQLTTYLKSVKSSRLQSNRRDNNYVAV